MLYFSNSVGIVICGRTPENVDRWLRILGRLAPNGFSFLNGGGGWNMGNFTVVEPNTTFEIWGPDWHQISQLVRWGKRLQRIEEQQAVSFVYRHPSTGWQARVIFDDSDWELLLTELRDVFQQEYSQVSVS